MERSVIVTKEEEEAEKKLLRPHRKLAYATGNFLTVLAVAMWFPYNITFFQYVIGLSAQNAGNIVLIAQAGGAISTPFVGMWSDKCRCKIPGRRKIFHLIGVITISCVFFFIWYDCLGCKNAAQPYKVLYYSCLAIIFQFSWASIQVGQLALLPEICAQKKTQVQLNSLRYSFTIIANLIIFGCFWLLLKFYSQDSALGSNTLTPNDTNIFLIMSAVVIGIGLPVTLPFQCLIPEKQNVNLPKQVWYRWLMNPKFYLTALCLIAARFIVLLPQTYMPLYFTKSLNMDKSSIAKGPLILFISSFVSTLVVKRCRNFVGDRMTYFIGMAIVWGATIFFWVKDPTTDASSHFNWSRDCIYIATILLGVGGAIVIVIALSMISFLVGNYKGSSAFVYGWILFVDRISNGIVVNVIQHLVPAGGDPIKLGQFYRHVLVYVPFCGSGLGLAVMLAFIGLDWLRKRKEKKEMMSKLTAPINYDAISDVSSISEHERLNGTEDLSDEIERFTETL